MRHLLPYFSLVILSINFLAMETKAQSPKDLAFIDKMEEKLSLSPSQKTEIIEIYHKSTLELDSFQQIIRIIEKSVTSEEQVRLQVLVLNQEKKDIKTYRDVEVESKLDAKQLIKYKAEIKPDKPTVLHFGIHNRADCRVCTK